MVVMMVMVTRSRGWGYVDTFALQMAISGERPLRIREELFISESQWESWQLDFSRVAALAGKDLNREQKR